MIGDTTRFYFFNKEYILPSGEGTLFYKMRMGLIPNEEAYLAMRYFHPTFLYESIWNLGGFIFLNLMYKRKKFDGQVALMYFAWYGFGRMFIEGLRTDSLYLPGTSLRISQCLGLACFLASAVLLTVFLIRAYRKNPALAAGAVQVEPDTAAIDGEDEQDVTEEKTEEITEEITETPIQEEQNDGNEN
jgi:prolipoprotein diacylglyceryltransferase